MGEPELKNPEVPQALPKIEVEQLVKKLESLPTLPTVMYELSRIIGDPMSSAGDVTKVMERDQSLTSKVLRLINSAYYAIPGGVTSLQRAIAYLGYDTINQLVLAASVFKSLNKTNNSVFDLAEFWKHAVGVAMTAETVGKWAKHKSPSDCFTTGLLHDLGKVALYQVAPEYLDFLVVLAKKENISLNDAEAKSGAVTHAKLGAILAKQWKLPPLIEGCVRFHHEIDPAKRELLNPEFNFSVDIVYFANSLVHEIGCGNSGHDQKIPSNGDLLRRLNLAPPQIPLLLKDVARNLASADDFLKIIVDQ